MSQKILRVKTLKETIEIFCNLNYNDFYNLGQKYRLEERQIASLWVLRMSFLLKF